MYVQFEHLRPAALPDLLNILRQKPEHAMLLGGGTDMLVDLRARKLSPTHLIDVKNIPQLREITETETAVRIGCAATLSQIAADPLVLEWAPALAQGASRVGCTQIRNKGTLAGNIQTASPAGDGLNAAYALDAEVVLLSPEGERRMPVRDYVRGPRRTGLGEKEFLAYIELPKRRWSFQQFFKVGLRNALAISVVNGAAAVELEDGVVKDVRLSCGAVGPTPLRITAAEELLLGQSLTDEWIAAVARTVADSVQPISDLRASAEYRAYMAGVMIKRQLETCREVCER